MSYAQRGNWQAFLRGLRQRRSNGRRGSTLLEVLIVAVVLLVGMFTVLRVFPVGFGVVERGGFDTLAGRYAQTRLNDLASNPGALPDGMLPAIYFEPLKGLYVNESRLRPSDLQARAPGTGSQGLQEFENSLVQFRRVYGETTRVPRASASTGSRYLLRFAPIEQYGNGPHPDLFVVYSLTSYSEVDKDDWEDRYDRRYRNRDGYYTIADSSDVPITDEDSGPHYLLFSGVDYDRAFKLDYSIRPGDPTAPAVQRLIGKPVFVPANSSGDPVRARNADGSDFSLDSAAGGYIWGTAVVRRRFREGQPPSGVSDPYWYEIPAVGGSVNPMGAIQLNPGLAGQWIGLDYSVMDWQILHDDIDVPMEPDPDRTGLPPGEQRAWVKLSFPYIDTNPIGAQGDNRVGMQDALIVQNIDPNSRTYGDVMTVPGTWSFADTVRGTDESRAGRVGLLVAEFNRTNDPVRRVRIYYRTMDNFTAQVIKPFANYTGAQVWAGEYAPGFNKFVAWNEPAAAPLRPYDDWQLIFALADVGNSVSVDYTYEAEGALRKVVGEMHTVDERQNRWVHPKNAGAQPARVGYITLNVPVINGARAPLRSIDSVRGMSLQVRVSWAVRGVPFRTYDILSAGWAGQRPEFWDEDGRGRMQTVTASAIVAKPR
ncbi:MAG: hypothetical protein HY321_01630 [Armatimonadetes bacterium]|nr:hypothetical protein [Armatimonadota bacterium]